MSDERIVEIYGVKIDAACAALLDIALHGFNKIERLRAIRRLGELDCTLALGVVGKEGQSSEEREFAIDLIKK